MFKEYKIAQIGEVVGGGTPSTSNEEYWGGNIPWITPKDLTAFSSVYISHGESSITETGLNKSGTRLLPANSVLFSSRAPIGYIAIAKNPLCTNQGFKNVICYEDIIDPLYFYYYIKANVDYFKQIGSGATFPEISGNVMRRIKISIIEDITLQKKVASLLYFYDNLIEVNNKRIKVLEQMAENLYKEWFVRFRFPGHETAEFENGMPKGWEIDRIGNIAKLINGRAFLMPELQQEGKYRIVRVGNFSGKDEWFYSDMELDDDKYCQNGDLLYKWACNFGPEFWNEEKVIYHYHIWKVVVGERVNKNYLYYLLKQSTPLWLGGTNGATMVHITKESMEKKKVLVPSKEILSKFEMISSEILSQIQIYQKSNVILEKQRDLLLPRLMSGKLEV